MCFQSFFPALHLYPLQTCLFLLLFMTRWIFWGRFNTDGASPSSKGPTLHSRRRNLVLLCQFIQTRGKKYLFWPLKVCPLTSSPLRFTNRPPEKRRRLRVFVITCEASEVHRNKQRSRPICWLGWDLVASKDLNPHIVFEWIPPLSERFKRTSGSQRLQTHEVTSVNIYFLSEEYLMLAW